MSYPVCSDHGRRAIYRNPHGYWHCGRCLDALFEWNAWVRKNLVPTSLKKEMMDMNEVISGKHIDRAIHFYKKNHDIYPDLHPPVGYKDENDGSYDDTEYDEERGKYR